MSWHQYFFRIICEMSVLFPLKCRWFTFGRKYVRTTSHSVDFCNNVFIYLEWKISHTSYSIASYSALFTHIKKLYVTSYIYLRLDNQSLFLTLACTEITEAIGTIFTIKTVNLLLNILRCQSKVIYVKPHFDRFTLWLRGKNIGPLRPPACRTRLLIGVTVCHFYVEWDV